VTAVARCQHVAGVAEAGCRGHRPRLQIDGLKLFYIAQQVFHRRQRDTNRIASCDDQETHNGYKYDGIVLWMLDLGQYRWPGIHPDQGESNQSDECPAEIRTPNYPTCNHQDKGSPQRDIVGGILRSAPDCPHDRHVCLVSEHEARDSIENRGNDFPAMIRSRLLARSPIDILIGQNLQTFSRLLCFFF
jgi:hypothetical protein